MKLSIVTINRNNAAGLRATLRSTFESQVGFSDWEQIVVDGASTDGSFAEVDQYRNDPRLGWCVSEPDDGIYNAMNKGAGKARGDYLLFLNSGDTLEPDVLSRVFPIPPDTDIAFGDLTVLKKKGPELKAYPDADRIAEWHFLVESLPHPASFISRRLFEGLGGYDESYRIVADLGFFLRAVRERNARLLHMPFLVARFDGNGISLDPAHAAEHRAERFRLLAPVFGEKLAERVTRPNPRKRPSFIRPAVLAEASRDKEFASVLRRASDAVRAAWKNRFGRFILKRLFRTR